MKAVLSTALGSNEISYGTVSGIGTFTLLVFRGANFSSATDLRTVNYKWNTTNLFIKIRYISIIDYVK